MTIGAMAVPVGRFVPAAAQGSPDVDLAVFAESVELATVDLYTAAAATGKLQPALLELTTAFAGHHQEHAGAFGAVAGAAARGTANQALVAEFAPLLQAAPDQAGVLGVLFVLEQAAAATYELALGVMQDIDVAAATATILPVEAQHAVALAESLGKPTAEYLPSFQRGDGALDPARYPA